MSFQIEFSFYDCSDVISKINDAISKIEDEKNCLSSALYLVESRLEKCIDNLSGSQDKINSMKDELSFQLSSLEDDIRKLEQEKSSISTGDPSSIQTVNQKLSVLYDKKKRLVTQSESNSRDVDKLSKKKEEIEENLKKTKDCVATEIKNLKNKQENLRALLSTAENAKKIMSRGFPSSDEGKVYINPGSLRSFLAFLSSYKNELGKELSSLRRSCSQMNEQLQDNVSSVSLEITDRISSNMGLIGRNMDLYAKYLDNAYECCRQYLKLASSFR